MSIPTAPVGFGDDAGTTHTRLVGEHRGTAGSAGEAAPPDSTRHRLAETRAGAPPRRGGHTTIPH
ncbi:hypothetical protein KIPE111705_03955 [Kibdelosporangium persicum]|uniref:hypothetical protein n=1 Tax=Kibdelosporangium persicum TaxID=2698649 RepID=UPI001563FEB5|nr:hypothetical protein [Kibdelosporangium persicum]